MGSVDEILEFTAADTDFNLLGSFFGLASFSAGQRLVIYNTSPVNLYENAANDRNPGIVTASDATLEIKASTPYPNEQHIEVNKMTGGFWFSQQSPGQRLFVIEAPTSYICDPDPVNGRIVRHSNYGFNET